MTRRIAALALYASMLAATTTVAYPTPHSARDALDTDLGTPLLARDTADALVILDARGSALCKGCKTDGTADSHVPSRKDKGKAAAKDDPVAEHRENAKKLNTEIAHHEHELHRLQKNIDYHAAKNPQPGTPAHDKLQTIKNQHQEHQEKLALKQNELKTAHKKIAAHDGAGSSAAAAADKGKGPATHQEDYAKHKDRVILPTHQENYAKHKDRVIQLESEIGQHRVAKESLKTKIATLEAQNHRPGTSGHDELGVAKDALAQHRKAIQEKGAEVKLTNTAIATHQAKLAKQGSKKKDVAFEKVYDDLKKAKSRE